MRSPLRRRVSGDADVEVIDLRWLQPWDVNAVLESARKTKRVVVSTRPSSAAGSARRSRPCSRASCSARSRPRFLRVAGKNTPVPYATELETFHIPRRTRSPRHPCRDGLVAMTLIRHRVRADGGHGRPRPDPHHEPPERKNAVDAVLHNRSDLHLDEARRRPRGTRRGAHRAGRAFSAGGDADFLRAVNTDAEFRWRALDEARRLVTELARFPLPVIAAVNGPAVAAGLEPGVVVRPRS